MNNTKNLAFVILAIAGLSGCATTRTADLARVDTAPAVEQVSRPAGYGSMGGYRYRRFVAVSIAAS